MAVKAEIFGEGPGRAEIRLTGMATTPVGDCSLRIQRNQTPDSYLGLNGRWQSSPESWHALVIGDVVAMPDGIAFKVGPLLVDPILTTLSESAFRLTLQSSAGQTTAPLVPSTQFPLLASSARHEEIAAELPPAPPPPPPQPDPTPRPEPMTLRVDPEDQFRPARGDEKIEKPVEKKSSGKGMLVAGIVAVIVLAAAGAGAYFYFQKAGPTAETASTAAPQSTREMLQTFMKDNPDTAKIVGKADDMIKSGNVEAALYLYRQGADHGDARSALQLGVLYDPSEATPGTTASNASTNGATNGAATNNAATSGATPSDASANTVTKSSDTAAFWYGKAADAGLAEAQRRLGMLLTKTHPAGTSEFDNGVTMLQAASKQGDAEATAKLKELGK
jgi:TPR repeat protein